MSVRHALLGFLNHRPMTGYELKRYFDQSIHHFWSAKLSQIYPTLNEMKKDGLLTMEVKYQSDKPNRKVYSITEAGRKELQRWLLEPVDLPQMRIPFLIQIFFSGGLKKQEVLIQLRRHLTAHQRLLASYKGPVQKVLQKNIEKTGLEREGIFWRLTLDAGIENEKSWIRWCRNAIKKIEEMDAEPA